MPNSAPSTWNAAPATHTETGSCASWNAWATRSPCNQRTRPDAASAPDLTRLHPGFSPQNGSLVQVQAGPLSVRDGGDPGGPRRRPDHRSATNPAQVRNPHSVDGRAGLWSCRCLTLGRSGSHPHPANSLHGGPPMAAAAPHPTTPRRRARHTTSRTTRRTTRPHPQPRRPRRGGRLLILGLTLTLVATLGTHALADDSNDSGSFFGPFGEAPGSKSNPDKDSGHASQLTATANPTAGGEDAPQTLTPAEASQDQQQAGQPGEPH